MNAYFLTFNHHQTMNNQTAYWGSSLLRVFLCGISIIDSYIGLTDSHSLFYLVASTGEGAVLMLLLVLLASIGMLDVLVNDCCQHKCRLQLIHDWRHFGFSSIAFCHVAMIFVAHEKFRSPFLTIYFLWLAVAMVMVALLDSNQRFQRSKDGLCTTGN